MITVEEWRLKMTENVQGTFNRLRGAIANAGQQFTKVQDKLREGTRNLGNAAKHAHDILGRMGGKLGSVLARFRSGFGSLFSRGAAQGGDNMVFSAEEARGMWNDKGQFRGKDWLKDRGQLKASKIPPEVAGFQRYIKEMMPKGVEEAFKAGGMRGLAPLMGKLGGLARFALGPVGIAAAMATMVGTKGYAAARDYAPSARELRLANLDKTPAEQQALQQQVLTMATGQGFDAKEATTAFIAVKRSSGESDAAVRGFVASVGKAAEAVNMDMPAMVDGTARAMKDFGLPLARANDLLDSNVKAMAAAGVSYKTLAEAQESYAAQARMANQRLNTANSLYAVFAANGRDAASAGTKLTQAMDALGKPKVVKGLKSIGVDVFDAKGQLRQMDDVVREMAPAFAKLNDAQFNTLKQQLGGPQGLKDLLDMVRSSGTDVLATLDKFKNSKLGIKDQLEAAKNDLDLMAKEVENRMNNAWLAVGEGLKPLFITVKKGMAWALEGVAEILNPGLNYQRLAKAEYEAIRKRVLDQAAPASTGTEEERQRGMADLYRERKTLQNAIKLSKENGIDYNVKRFTKQLNENQMAILAAQEAWGKMKAPADGTAPEGSKPGGGPGADDPWKDGSTAIVGGGKQVRNVNVTIQKLVEKLEVRTSTTVREGITSVRQEVEQALIDIVRGGEAALANG